MSAIPTIIHCPVCESYGAVLRHDLRASLVYCCQDCLHEWQIESAEDRREAEPGISESPRTAAARLRARLLDDRRKLQP